jgi:hypothetical protein
MDAPSVTIPSVPSAPMNNFVKSGPAADLRALERVLMISPFGSTTVCGTGIKLLGREFRQASYNVKEPFGFCSPIPNSICCGNRSMKAKLCDKHPDLLPEPPVLTMPPIVAPGPGSSYTGCKDISGQMVAIQRSLGRREESLHTKS